MTGPGEHIARFFCADGIEQDLGDAGVRPDDRPSSGQSIGLDSPAWRRPILFVTKVAF